LLVGPSMNDQELIKKLNILKEIKPESAWKQETRDILLAQVSNSVSEEVKVSAFEMIVYNFKNSFSFLPATAWTVICLILILTGGVTGTLAAKNSKPGDPLYIAKIVKEKIQLAMTFDREDKARLDMKLANIHAKEITEVLSSPNFNFAGNQRKAEQLAQSFNQEINTVKQRYSEISKMQGANPSPDVSLPTADIANGDDSKVGIGNLQKDGDSKVYGVESGKDNKGLQFYDPGAGTKNAYGASNVSSSPAVVPTAIPLTKQSSSSPSATAASSSAGAVIDNIDTTLDRAAQSFASKDFSGAKDILDKVGKIIENIDSTGAVKGVKEVGTSTEAGGAVGVIGSSSSKK
jgi:hypothetical protein